LNGVSQLQSQGRSQSRGAFGDVNVERDRSPRFENSAIAPSKGVVARPYRTRQDLGDRDRRDCEAQSARGMRFKEQPESRCELWMILENVNDGRRIDKEQRPLRQIAKL
jgi:hypothetical protein